MKIQLYDEQGKQILPITVEKAKKLSKQKKVKPLSKNPPKLKLIKNSFGTGISRKLFLLFEKHGEKTVKSAVLAGIIAVLVFGGVVAFLINHNKEANDPNDLIIPTQPNSTQQIVTEPSSTTEPTTETTTTVTEQTTTKPTTTTTTTKSTTKKQTTTKRTTKAPATTTARPTTERPTTQDNGLPSPGGEDDDTLPEPGAEDELPIL